MEIQNLEVQWLVSISCSKTQTPFTLIFQTKISSSSKHRDFAYIKLYPSQTNVAAFFFCLSPHNTTSKHVLHKG